MVLYTCIADLFITCPLAALLFFAWLMRMASCSQATAERWWRSDPVEGMEGATASEAGIHRRSW